MDYQTVPDNYKTIPAHTFYVKDARGRQYKVIRVRRGRARGAGVR